MAKTVYMLSSVLTLVGCSHLPDVDLRPSLQEYDSTVELPDLPIEFHAQRIANVQQMPADRVTNWLGEFDTSGHLEGIVNTVLESNPSLTIVKAAKAQAEAGLKGDRSSLFPVVQFSGGGSGTHRVQNAQLPNSGSSTDWTGSDRLAASWEIDLWGKLRRAVKEGQASVLAADFDLADLELSLTGQTITSWINLAATERLIAVSTDTLSARKRVLNLTERRVLEGTTTALDVRTARSAVAGAEAEIARLRQSHAETRRLLNRLMGRYPSADGSFLVSWPEMEDLAVFGGPMQLLARRPDVRAAEQRLVAAGLGVDQARRALFPSLSLSAQADQGINSLLDNANLNDLVATVAVSLVQTLYDGGARKAQIAAAEASAKQSVGTYLNTALTALSEVENALAADYYINEQIKAQMRALQESKAAERIGERNYINGLISVFELINTQTSRLDSERALINLELSKAVNRVDLYIALGGGLPNFSNESQAQRGQISPNSGRSQEVKG